MGLVSLGRCGEKMKRCGGRGASVAQSGQAARSEVVPGYFFRLVMMAYVCASKAFHLGNWADRADRVLNSLWISLKLQNFEN